MEHKALAVNRLTSIGIAVAIAPALLLAVGAISRSDDMMLIAEAALFWAALPIGAGLVVAGLIAYGILWLGILLNACLLAWFSFARRERQRTH